MPGIFASEAYTDTLATAETYLVGNGFTLNKPIKDGVVYLDSAPDTDTWKLQVAFWNGTGFMKYHDLIEDDGETVNKTAGQSAEYGLKIQEFWKEPVFGLKFRAVRISGSQDIVFTNAQVDYTQ